MRSPNRQDRESAPAISRRKGQALRYTAPALEKGLDVIELLARTPIAMNLATICRRLRRTPNELFRMLQVLETKGFIVNDGSAREYRLTEKLFALAMVKPPIDSLEVIAMPFMRNLARTTGQSCHLSVMSDGQAVVIARQEQPGDMGFSVRLGYRRDVTKDASGLVLLAFQSEETRAQWLANSNLSGQAESELANLVSTIRRIGWHVGPSRAVSGISELSAPILVGSVAIASLGVLFADGASLTCDAASVSHPLREAAGGISMAAKCANSA